MSAVIRIHPADDVVIARRQLLGGTRVDSEGITVAGLVPPGHKIAVRPIAAGAPVRRYNQIIGFATQAIAPGQHVHTHNLAFSTFERAHEVGAGVHATAYVDEPATFMGIVRDDGRIATRNYIGVLTSVNCSATAARAIADQFRRDIHPEALADYPNVDGVVALTHGQGCATASDGEELLVLRRTLGGYAKHPNFAAVLVVGLGCETNQIQGLMAQEGLAEGARLQAFSIQDTGGTAKTVARGVQIIKGLLKEANRVKRQPVSASHVTVGLQCGGSDGYSGISANPALGAAVDRLVRNGGSAILSETPEIYGGEHLLTRRAVSREVADKLLARIRWWEAYTRTQQHVDGQQPVGRQQGRRPDHHSGKVAGRDRQERHHQPGRRGRVRRGRQEPGASSTWTRPATTRCRPPARWPAAPTSICFTTGRGSAYGCAP